MAIVDFDVRGTIDSKALFGAKPKKRNAILKAIRWPMKLVGVKR